jgi:hypothetical protein
VSNRTAWALVVIGAGLILLRSGGPPGPGPAPPGERQLVIVHDATKDTPAHGRLFNALVTNDLHASVIAGRLTIYDTQAEDQSDQAVALVTALNAAQPPPGLFVLAGERIVGKAPLPGTATDVVEFFKKHGG